MKQFSVLMVAFFCGSIALAQEIDFTEYDLNNGLHVILHQDQTAPVVSVGVMYHVGAKNEEPGRSGFAHFFEHLLFEGTKNIKRGQWDKIVSSHGGSGNANTTQDRTYYYENFPSNNLELGLWMESERMLHPKIGQVGVETQKEVVKEEKRTRIDNSPYGKIIYGGAVEPHLFLKHPYKTPTIGRMEDIDAARLNEFKAFFKTYYVPNNATLTVAGDIDIEQTKSWIQKYFSGIPQGQPINRIHVKEDPITQTITAKEYDNNIQVAAKIFAYRTPGMSAHDSYVLDMISTLLTKGKSSRMHQKIVDDDELALQVMAFNRTYEDYGAYIVGALPLNNTPLDTLGTAMDRQIDRLKNEMISKKEYEKLQNLMKTSFVNENDSQEKIASSLAKFYTLYDGQTDLINKELDIYKSISRREIKEVANKYLNKNQRLELDYLPGSSQEN